MIRRAVEAMLFCGPLVALAWLLHLGLVALEWFLYP